MPGSKRCGGPVAVEGVLQALDALGASGVNTEDMVFLSPVTQALREAFRGRRHMGGSWDNYARQSRRHRSDDEIQQQVHNDVQSHSDLAQGNSDATKPNSCSSAFLEALAASKQSQHVSIPFAEEDAHNPGWTEALARTLRV